MAPLREALAALERYQDLKGLEDAYQAWIDGAVLPGIPIGPRQPGPRNLRANPPRGR